MNSQNDSIANINRIAGGELSLKARLGYVALLLASSAMTTVIVSLWLTEQHLPLRAKLAFGVMSMIGAAWAALSVWALSTRRVLLARDRLIAGREVDEPVSIVSRVAREIRDDAHRDTARLYCKQINAGQGEHQLSPEEQEAVRLALAGGEVQSVILESG